MKLKFLPQVYEPREDSGLLQEQIVKFCRGKTVLDMGCGCGIQAITAALNGAEKVVAVDINPVAIKLTAENVKQNNVEIEAFESNLFSNIKEKFDLIVFNAPYLPLAEFEKAAKREGLNTEVLQWSGGKKIILEFLKQAKNHLNKNGTVLFVFSSLTKLPKIENLEILASQKFGFEEIFVGLLKA